MISRLYILTTTSRLTEKYIFQKHLGELYFLNRAVKAAEARRVRAPPVNFSCKACSCFYCASLTGSRALKHKTAA